jgi:hypothetical protein
MFGLWVQFPSQLMAQETATGGGAVSIIEVEVTERNIEGELNACEFRYLLGYQDNIYSHGAMVALRGSISFNANSKSKRLPFVILKVTGFDINGSKPGLFHINYAYLSSQGTSFTKKEYTKFTCDDGGLCVGYDFISNPALVPVLPEKIEINFNRSAGGSDVSVPINLNVNNPQEARKMLNCKAKLFDLIRKNIQ